MSGNAMEEGLMTQINNSSHLDPSRIGFLAGFVPALLIVIFLPGFIPRLTGFGATMIALSTGLIIGVLVTRRLAGKIRAAQVARMIAARARAEAHTQRQIKELNI